MILGGADVLKSTSEPRLDMLGGFIEAIPAKRGLLGIKLSKVLPGWVRFKNLLHSNAFNTKFSTTIVKRLNPS